MIVNVADGNASYSYEWATFDMKRRLPDRDGLLVATNHFVDPGWEMVEPRENESLTVLRRNNLMALGERYKGRLDVNTMMKILDTGISQGGATKRSTTIQSIVVPEDRVLWVKAPGYQNWTEVDLGELFIS